MTDTHRDFRLNAYDRQAAKIVDHLRSLADSIEREAKPYGKPGVTGIEAIEQVIYDVAVDHPMWIGDDGQSLDYLPERESRLGEFVVEAATAIAATLADREARVRVEALREAAGEWQSGAGITLMIRKPTGVPAIDYAQRVLDWLCDRADRQEPQP